MNGEHFVLKKAARLTVQFEPRLPGFKYDIELSNMNLKNWTNRFDSIANKCQKEQTLIH